MTFSSGRPSVPFSPVLPSSAWDVRPGGGEGRDLVAARNSAIWAGTGPDQEERGHDISDRNITVVYAQMRAWRSVTEAIK